MGAGVRFFVSMALMLFLASAVCSQPCQPYQVLGVVQYSNGAHPSGENLSIVVKDLSSSESISYLDVGGGYSPNTGAFQLELGNLQQCVKVGDVLRLTVVDGKAGGVANLTLIISDENVVAGGDTKFGVVVLTIPSEPSSCGDGIQNQGEEGVDCGGRCKPCFVPTTTLKPVPATTVQVSSSTVVPVSSESTTVVEANKSVKSTTIVGQNKTTNETKLKSAAQQQKRQEPAGGSLISDDGLIILAIGVVVLFALLVLLAVVLIYLKQRKQ